MSRSLQFVLITIAALAILWMLLSIFFDFVVRMTMFPAVGFESTEIDPAFRKAYAAEHITIDTDAGDAVSALYFTWGDRGLILYFHGNGERLNDVQYEMETFALEGFSVLAIDYPGYGESTGVPSREANTASLKAVYEYSTNTRKYDAEKIICVGYSVGTAMAIALADMHPPAGIVLFAPFSSDRDMAAHIFWFDIYGLFFQSAHYSSIEIAETLDMPVLVIHGTADATIPYGMGEAIFAAFESTDKQFVSLPDTGHDDIFMHMGSTTLKDAFTAFFSVAIPDSHLVWNE